MVKRALIGLSANKFMIKIRSFYNDPLGNNNAREILDRGCHKRHPRQGGDNSIPWFYLLIVDLFIFGNNIIEIFL